MTKAHVSDLVIRYRLQGWTGLALAQRIRKHARLLRPLDPEAAAMLLDYVNGNNLVPKPRRVA